jgi:hypothetical protein
MAFRPFTVTCPKSSALLECRLWPGLEMQFDQANGSAPTHPANASDALGDFLIRMK